MAHLKEVVTRINLITSTQQITQAMKMIAASKLHKIQQLLLPFKEYMMQYSLLVQAVLQGIDRTALSHPLLIRKNHQPQRLLIIVIAADRGLCGAFNKNVLRAANCYIDTCKTQRSVTIELLVIGKKAYQFFKKTHLPIIDDYVDLLERSFVQGGVMLTAHCIKAYQEARYTEILWVYTAFKNAVKQTATVVPFLPLWFRDDWNPLSQQSLHYIYEPNQQLLIAQLIPDLIKNQAINMLAESMASEHAARMTTMTQATDNADGFLKLLRIHYNSRRQQLITNSLSEITSGAEALTGS